jgi:predicted PurR-regulated permease PerM
MTNTTGFTPAMRILLVLAAIFVVLWGMSSYASFINSAGLALLIVLAADPLINLLRRRGWSRWATLIATLAVVLVVLGALAVFMLYSVALFARDLPQYEQQAQAAAQELQARLQGLGVSATTTAALDQQASPAQLLDFVNRVVAVVGDVVGNLITLLLVMIFLFVDVIVFPGRLEAYARAGHDYARRVAGFTDNLRRYIVVMVSIGAVLGVFNSIWFWIMGVPNPVLWGALSGILNFIPYIGFWLGLAAPAIMTLLDDGWGRMIVMAVGYILINGFAQNVIQPRMLVRRLDLTPFTYLLATTFWLIVLGPVGAMIGVPLTMAFGELVLQVDPTTRWLGNLMYTKVPEQGDGPPISPA